MNSYQFTMGMVLISPTHTSTISDSPSLAPHASRDIEQTVRVKLVLDTEQLGVVGTIKGVLEIKLLVVGLVHVSSGPRGGGLYDGLDLLGDAVLFGDHIGEGRLEAPRKRQ